MNIRFYIFLFTILLFAKISQAQDFHLSQYDANPLYLNPALTGMKLNEDWKYRFNLNYREQKGNFLGRSNKIIATGFDMPLNNKFSIGEFVINNKTINSSINTLNLMLSGSYKIIHKAANGHDRHNMSVGLQVGLLQKSFNPAGFVYDSQYSPSYAGGFDPTLPTGENYIKQSVSRFDMNMGVYYHFIDKNKKYSPYGGFSIYHLSQPNQSFTDINSQTPMRFTLHGGCLYKINEAYSLLPQFMYMNQAHARELNIGIMAFDKIRCTDYEPMLGFSWRAQNAYIVHLGLKYKTYFFRVSYDVNTYYLKQYGNRGLELSIVYTPKKKTPVVDLVAILVPIKDSVSKDSVSSLTPIIPSSRVVLDTVVIQKKLPEPLTPTKVDTTASLPTQPITTPIVHDTIIIVEKSVVQTETIVKDSVKPVSTIIPDSFPVPDSTNVPTKSMEVILPTVKDTIKPVSIVLNTIAKIDSTTVQPKPIETISPIAKDSAVIILPKQRIRPVASDTPYAMFKKSVVLDSSAVKTPDSTVTPKILFITDSLFTKLSYRVQLGAFKEEVPLEIANRLLTVGAKQIKNMKDAEGYTIYTVGDFSTHDEAIDLKNEMIKKGFNDAFIMKISPNKSNAPLIPQFPITPDSLFDIFHQDK